MRCQKLGWSLRIRTRQAPAPLGSGFGVRVCCCTHRPGRMAGAPGFEPGNGGTKNRCLTAWRRPIVGRELAATPAECNRQSGRAGLCRKVACKVAAAWPPGAARFASCACLAPALYAPIRSKPVIAERALARCRSVAQPGRALRSGRRGRRFKSCHSDHFPTPFELMIVNLWRFWHQAAKPFATT